MAAVLGRDLRLGKDLRGGVSLVYKVEIPEEEIDPSRCLTPPLKSESPGEPQGIFDISIEGSGRDRIEVVMPLPGPETRPWPRHGERLWMNWWILRKFENPKFWQLWKKARSVTSVARWFGSGHCFDALVGRGRGPKEAREAYNAVPEDAASTDRLRGAAVADAEISFDDFGRLDGTWIVGRAGRRILTLPNKPILERDEEGRGRRDESGTPSSVLAT